MCILEDFKIFFFFFNGGWNNVSAVQMHILDLIRRT